MNEGVLSALLHQSDVQIQYLQGGLECNDALMLFFVSQKILEIHKCGLGICQYSLLVVVMLLILTLSSVPSCSTYI